MLNLTSNKPKTKVTVDSIPLLSLLVGNEPKNHTQTQTHIQAPTPTEYPLTCIEIVVRAWSSTHEGPCIGYNNNHNKQTKMTNYNINTTLASFTKMFHLQIGKITQQIFS